MNERKSDIETKRQKESRKKYRERRERETDGKRGR